MIEHEDWGPKDICVDELSSMIATEILERSQGIMKPFRVSFDPECSFCKKNRQIYLANNAEYEHPEPTFIKRLPASVAALSYEQDYPGRSLVVLRDHETSMDHVLKNKLLLYLVFMEDVSAVAEAINGALHPAKINYAVYMNQNDHFHMHLIPRYESEGKMLHYPPVFRGTPEIDRSFDYRSMALKIRKHMPKKRSSLSRYVEKMINSGLP